MSKLRFSKAWLAIALVALLLGTSAAIQAAPVAPGVQPQATELPPQSKIEQRLETAVTSGEQVGMFITFAEKPDLSPAYKMGWEERGKFVYETLKQTADKSQARVQAFLKARQIPYQSFIIDNSIYIQAGDLSLLNNLAAFSEVSLLRQERFYAVPDVKIETGPVGILALEWGVSKIGADAVWAKGYTGQGIVVANIDTGVRYTHSALVGKYRGNLGGGSYNHTYSWSDPTGTYPSAPGDNNGHGSHTMGTMVGDDGAGNQIGVAPGAKWIACKGCSSSSCADATLNACADWMLAPGGNTSMRPNVVNNSWGGCTYDNWYRTKVEAWRAAGIHPVFSAGNTSNCGYSSASCGTVGTPATYKEVTAVGSTTSSDGISSFSLWGPSKDPANLNEIKPEVSAPGSSIRSSYYSNDTSYTTMSGTSMAAPHVSGALALIWSACPSLKGNFDATELLLKNTAKKIAYATACGNEGAGNIPNNAFGYGRIDVLAAVNSCSSTGPTPTPTITPTPSRTPTPSPTPTGTVQPTTIFFDNFETNLGWTVNAGGTDTATIGKWERGDPAATTYSGNKQLGTTVSGVNDLVTGRLAGTAAGDYDVDGGVTSIRSPSITLSGGATYSLSFSFYLAHYSNSSSADYFRVKIVTSSGTTTVFEELGAANNDNAAWETRTISLNSYAGQTIQIQFEAADTSTASLVEAAVDDVRVTRQ